MGQEEQRFLQEMMDLRYNDPAAALNAIDDALLSDRIGSNEALKLWATYLRADIHGNEGKIQEAISDLQRILDNIESLPSMDSTSGFTLSHLRMRVLTSLGGLDDDLEKFTTAKGYYHAALDIANELQDFDYQSILFNNLALTFEKEGDNPAAFEYCERAVRIQVDLQRTGSGTYLYYANSLYSLAGLCLSCLNPVAARIYLDEIDFARVPLDWQRVISRRYAHIELHLGNFTAALAYVESAIQLSERFNDEPDLCCSLIIHAETLLGLERIEEAVTSARRAVQLKSDVVDRCQALAILANALARPSTLQDLEQSRTLLNEAESLALSLPKSRLDLVLLLFSDAERQIGSHQMAYDLLRQYLNVSQSTYLNSSTAQRLSSLKILLEAEREAHEKEIQQLRAQHFERELANSTLQLLAQTELLSRLRDDLLKVVQRFPMPDGATKVLRERLKDLPTDAIDWKKFDEQFKAAHPEFVKALLEQYPTLTPAEVRICSLLRANMHSEEIARLLCLSERSIESHRYNIRRKMQLDRSVDLMLHMQTL